MQHIALLSLLALSSYSTTFGQQAANATLTGTITDPHGALVAGVSITAIHKATGAKRETVSNDGSLFAARVTF